MKLEYIIDEEISIRDFIERNISRKFKRYLKRVDTSYYINDNSAKNYNLLKPGDRLTILYPEDDIVDNHPFKMDLNIVHEAPSYMIINKPKGLKSIPTGYNNFESLYNGIIYYYKEKGIKGTIHFINRLDKDTEGLLLVCKDKYSAGVMSKELDNIKREYLAICDGVLEGSGTIDEPIALGENEIRVVSNDGKRSITHYEAISNDGNNTLVRLSLETGRTHQIRVHMKHIGHPLSGDPLYGSGDDLKLCSFRIEFDDPFDGSHIIKEIKPSFLKE